jgi:SpoVK/Ycf46/Vps4 family AAA+-type ATPase
LDDSVDIEKLADQTEGYTGRDIASLSSAPVMLALQEHVTKYRSKGSRRTQRRIENTYDTLLGYYEED